MLFRKNKIAAIALCGVFAAALATPFSAGISASAEEAIEKYAKTDEELYEALKKHILIESLFPRFVLCTTYAKSYSVEQRKEMRKAFIEDFEKLGNTTHQEHYTIADVTSTWDLT